MLIVFWYSYSYNKLVKINIFIENTNRLLITSIKHIWQFMHNEKFIKLVKIVSNRYWKESWKYCKKDGNETFWWNNVTIWKEGQYDQIIS